MAAVPVPHTLTMVQAHLKREGLTVMSILGFSFSSVSYFTENTSAEGIELLVWGTQGR